jgi:outer membrane immunogenic protein
MLKLLASAFALSLTPALSLAAEPIMVPIDSSGRGVSIADTPTDWGGFYAGVYGAAQASRNNGVQPGIGVTVGVNAQIDFVLVGTEVSLHGLIGDSVDTATGRSSAAPAFC